MHTRAFHLGSKSLPIISNLDTSSMASLLSLPDEVIDIIGIATERWAGI